MFGCSILSLVHFGHSGYNKIADRGDYEMQTGQIIMKLRSDAGFTQARLADMLLYRMISYPTKKILDFREKVWYCVALTGGVIP